MSRVLRSYILILIDIILLALLLGVVAIFGNISRAAYIQKENEDVKMYELKEFRAMQYYVNQDYMTGDDILGFIGKFKRKCNIKVQYVEGTNENSNLIEVLNLNKNDTRVDAWNLAEIKKELSGTDDKKVTMGTKYKIKGELDMSSKTYDNLVFFAVIDNEDVN